MNSVEVRSLLRERSGELIPVEYATPARRRWESVDGAIELTVGANPLITATEWDDVGALWAYIAGMINRICGGAAEAHTYFPDQPISFRLSRYGHGLIEATCEIGDVRRRAVSTEQELIGALCRSGIEFFDHLVRLGARAEDYQTEREMLARCLERLGHVS